MGHAVAFVNSIGHTFTTITDSFTRSESNGWGSATTGQAWTASGTATGGADSDYSVSGTQGSLSLTSAAVSRRPHLASLDVADADATVTITVPALALTASLSAGLLFRYTDSSNHIRAELTFDTSNNFIVRVIEASTSGGVQVIANSSTISSYTAASSWKLRARIIGQTFQAKAWAAAGSEPDDWDVAGLVTDATVMADTGPVGIRAIRESGNTNGTVAFLFDDLSVSSPTQTRLDLNDESTWKLLDSGTEFPPPPLKRAVASTLMVDGARVPASAYDNRVLSLRLQLTAASEDASATALQNVFRELDRPFNILKWHPTTATNPVFFRTFRSSASAVREVLPSGGLREFEVDLLAEPFAYGLRKTLATSTVTNDPASSCYLDIDSADALGDVETPLMLQFDYTQIDGFGPTAISVRRRGIVALTPFVLQAEAMTGGTDTSIQANDAVMSGSGQNYMRCTFATVGSTMTTRLTSAVWPTTAAVENRGTYRVFLRCRKSVSGNDINVELGWVFGASSGSNPEVALPATTNRRWIDLGLVQIPFAADPVYDGLSGVELPARGGVFTVAAQRTSGSGNVDFDALAFVPADDRFALVSWPTTSGPVAAVVDATSETVHYLGVDASVYARELASLAGRFPYLTPNQDNRVFVLLNAGGSASSISDDITSTVAVTPSYYPAYLYVRPAAT